MGELSLESRDPCLICGGTRFVRRFPRSPAPAVEKTPHEPYRITHSERRLVGGIERCADCGMEFLPLDYLPSASYSDAADPYYLEQEGERVLNAHRLLEHVPSGGRLLEIGCAVGFLLRAAQERGFEATGVEMSEWASGIARDQFGLDVRCGTLEAAELESDSFDVVVLADVIEHLTDPRRTLREIRRVLKPGGRLLLLTPDAGSTVAKLFGTSWWGLLDDHYFYFSKETLRRFLESEGFSIEVLKAQGREFPLKHWLSKVAQYNEVAHRVVSAAARAVGVADRRVSINLGDMMACVARKESRGT
jgi:SAM-dependent methyltransferase